MHSAIAGVRSIPLESRTDERGSLTEIFRAETVPEIDPVQWNVVASDPGVLRGVHCHVHHADLLVPISGELILGLVDLRRGSSSERVAEIHHIPGLTESIHIPVGVAHGFAFEVPTTIAYGVDHYWNLDDELGCRWNDPDLGLDWPITHPILSERDRTAGTAALLIAEVNSRLGR